jgi:hypothetical protein
MAASAFLQNEFADFEMNTVTANGGESWTRPYMRGRETYIEFSTPAGIAKSNSSTAVGRLAIGISGDTRGVIEELEDRLRRSGIKTESGTRRRRFGNREVDWFKWMAIARPSNESAAGLALDIWAMEYVPTFFDVPEAGKEAPEGPNDVISRERYQSDVYQKRMMRDVRAVESAVTESDFREIEPMLRVAGFRLSRTGTGVVADGEHSDLVFHFVSPESIGLRSIELLLNAPVGQRVERIGNSTLTIDLARPRVGILRPNDSARRLDRPPSPHRRVPINANDSGVGMGRQAAHRS